MRALTARDILRLWEVCQALHPIDRALAMVGAATGTSAVELAALPIGERERLAAVVRVHTFGDVAEGAEACPACGLVHEVDPPLAALIAAPTASAAPFAAQVGDVALTLRLPDSRDQAAMVLSGDPARAVRTLLARCVVEAARDGQLVPAAALDDACVAEIAALLEARDGNADNRIGLTCADCGHAWDACFDAGEFLWLEVRERARRLLYEVNALARAFHWSEDAILALSTRRRAAYLEMVGS